MKTYKQLASDAMEKAAEIKKKRNRNIKIASAVCSAFAVTVAITIALLPNLMKKPVSPAESEINEGEQVKVEILTAANSYDSIYRTLKRSSIFKYLSDSVNGGIILEGAVDDAEDVIAPDSSTGTGENDYSGTNVQVQGIDEADVIKCDGSYIYSLGYNYVFITAADASNGKLETVSSIEFKEHRSEYGNFNDMYITENRLIIIGNTSIKANTKTRDAVILVFYDISDRKNPKYLDTLTISGFINDTRMTNGKIYLISTDYFYDSNFDRAYPETYVPTVDGEPVSAEDVYYDDYILSCYRVSYLNVNCIDIEKMEAESTLSLLGYGYSKIYQSHNNIYCFQSYANDTKIIKISTEGDISIVAECKVDGYLLNSYSMDEYSGNLRLVTTDWQSGHNTNGVYVFDEKLNCIGKIEDLAKDERIYSCRFDGEVAYFVTFRETDPLFCADLSDPKNPKILSELKIPGFSEYLHKYSDNLLFGLGRSATETSSGFVKLSMFDISDKTNVSEVATLTLKGVYYTDASYDFHAILVDGAKGLIGFRADNKYLLFTYRDGEFVKLAELDISGYSTHAPRGIYIGNYFFVCTRTGIASYSLDALEKIDELSFGEDYEEYYYYDDYILID